MPQSEIEEAAKAELIAIRTLKRAKKALKIRSEKEKGSMDGKWYWMLPENTEAGDSENF